MDHGFTPPEPLVFEGNFAEHWSSRLNFCLIATEKNDKSDAIRLSMFNPKAQPETRQILCHRKNFYHRTVKSLSAGRSCGKIDARLFEQFSNLSSLSIGHNQLEIIYER